MMYYKVLPRTNLTCSRGLRPRVARAMVQGLIRPTPTQSRRVSLNAKKRKY